MEETSSQSRIIDQMPRFQALKFRLSAALICELVQRENGLAGENFAERSGIMDIAQL